MNPKHTFDESLLIVQQMTEDLDNSSWKNLEEAYAQIPADYGEEPLPRDPKKGSRDEQQEFVNLEEDFKKYLV